METAVLKNRPTTVSFHNDKAIPFYNRVVQLDHEISLLKKVKEMYKQKDDANRLLDIALRQLKAANAGFDPYIPPTGWYSGWLERKQKADTIYRHALPIHAIERYLEAKKLGVFDEYLVYSPDASVFGSIAPSTTDPILVGWVGASSYSYERSGRNLIKDEDSRSFMIANWDIAKDLRAGGLIQLPESTKEQPKPRKNVTSPSVLSAEDWPFPTNYRL